MIFHSQAGQDEWVLRTLNQKRNGYFVDCGAFDGIELSNTCILEKEFGWKGICIEPNDRDFKKLRDNRNCICVNSCVDEKKQRVKFSNSSGGGAGIIDKGTMNEGKTNFVLKYTITLKEILDKYNAPKIIDYLSLDVEGTEERVLKDFPFDEYTFLTMSIERPSEKLKEILKQNGYIEIYTIWDSGIILDVLYIHKSLREVKNDMKIAIIGYGRVGKSLKNLFENAILYDTNNDRIWATKKKLNECDIGIVCVPTPMADDGSANLRYVEEVMLWIDTPLIILKSTVPPGTTEYLKKKYKKHIVFSPGYIGEKIDHPMSDLKNRNFWIFGGDKEDTKKAIEFWKNYVKTTARFYQTDSRTTEIVKYMKNCFFATKVTFCNEFYEICKSFGRDYNEIRELWLADPRINRDHTQVYENNRGFSGKCLPKDLSAIIEASIKAGYIPEFLKEVQKNNKRIKKFK